LRTVLEDGKERGVASLAPVIYVEIDAATTAYEKDCKEKQPERVFVSPNPPDENW
jgi:hypothetical protein